MVGRLRLGHTYAVMIGRDWQSRFNDVQSFARMRLVSGFVALSCEFLANIR